MTAQRVRRAALHGYPGREEREQARLLKERLARQQEARALERANAKRVAKEVKVAAMSNKRDFKGVKSNTFDEAQLDEVANMYEQKHMSLQAIASHFGCSDAPVKNALIMRGIKPRRACVQPKPLTVVTVNPYTGCLRLSDGEYVIRPPHKWNVGDVYYRSRE